MYVCIVLSHKIVLAFVILVHIAPIDARALNVVFAQILNHNGNTFVLCKLDSKTESSLKKTSLLFECYYLNRGLQSIGVFTHILLARMKESYSLYNTIKKTYKMVRKDRT